MRLVGEVEMQNLKNRTFKFAVDVLRFGARLPKTQEHLIVSKQLMRAGTSVGSNYRAACRGRSRAEFLAKLSIVEEESDESMFWLEVLFETGFRENSEAQALYGEATEILKMIVASKKTARINETNAKLDQRRLSDRKSYRGQKSTLEEM